MPSLGGSSLGCGGGFHASVSASQARYHGEMQARTWETLIRTCVEILAADTARLDFTLDEFCARWKKEISDLYPRR